MSLLPSIASSNIADLFTKPLSSHRYTQLVIGDDPTIASTTSVATPTLVASTTTVDLLAAVVDPASDPVTTTTTSDLVPTTLPIVLDTGASFSRTPFASDFLPVAQAPYGLFRSASASVASSFKVSSPVDLYTLITGEDVSVDLVDLSSLDTTIDCLTSDSNSDKVYFDVREFGTASLTFIFSPNLSLIKVFVTPTQVDWIHWVPLPRLILPESYFHVFGFDYLQAFALFHLIPIWIYYLLHFAVNLE